ncbi:PAQR-type receptor NDAI_0A07160 [Naumovozyma dairenensis CBS 421]|uniref:Uncharacterized protein n=1 Tax=Naumovozyma dairenensis (strain ATCC 10597 / BCRC 20456 / CBS 421 / NBRC 0211 / NRRL Y-12639) TaxID=1071378 RepID=G0W4Y2_NAUDC|nr:hypothetical protein NDAI_0A07160 [Naumovozyma dairenensis CBS 421]CCD22870.1 hypothetical protein NDAI_0A07160 [Naumovozyma dairenensis CBS 421]
MASTATNLDNLTTTCLLRSRSNSVGGIFETNHLEDNDTSQKPKTNRRKRKIHLSKFDELPEWQKDNDKILTGYVRETNSFIHCFQSLFYLNNETINIYTHLIPSIIYLIVSLTFIFINFIAIPKFPTTSVIDYIVINIFILGAFTCLLLSSCFHCLKQHSFKQCTLWSKLDYIGIIILISCSIIPILYFGYFDRLSYFKFFTILTFSFAIVCSIIVLNEKFDLPSYRPLRAGLFMLFSFTGLIPMITGFYIFGYKGVMERISLNFVLLEAIFYIIGTLLYGFRIPETFKPGNFDMFGSSHQIFHIFVVLGSICHFGAVIKSYCLMHHLIN